MTIAFSNKKNIPSNVEMSTHPFLGHIKCLTQRGKLSVIREELTSGKGGRCAAALVASVATIRDIFVETFGTTLEVHFP